MKSTRKPFYNHRIAQSKEKWETDFLSKINDANGLLYLAAKKSNSYGAIDDSYYTEENKPKILSTLDEIVNSCLLYTSPSPRDRQKSRMPSSA